MLEACRLEPPQLPLVLRFDHTACCCYCCVLHHSPPSPTHCPRCCRGLADLRQGIIRTPMEPKETFMDGEQGSWGGHLQTGRQEQYIRLPLQSLVCFRCRRQPPTHPATSPPTPCLASLLPSSWPADPLRVLRAVRFASRFGFELEATLLQAAADDEVGACCYYCCCCGGLAGCSF